MNLHVLVKQDASGQHVVRVEQHFDLLCYTLVHQPELADGESYTVYTIISAFHRQQSIRLETFYIKGLFHLSQTETLEDDVATYTVDFPYTKLQVVPKRPAADEPTSYTIDLTQSVNVLTSDHNDILRAARVYKDQYYAQPRHIRAIVAIPSEMIPCFLTQWVLNQHGAQDILSQIQSYLFFNRDLSSDELLLIIAMFSKHILCDEPFPDFMQTSYRKAIKRMFGDHTTPVPRPTNAQLMQCIRAARMLSKIPADEFLTRYHAKPCRVAVWLQDKLAPITQPEQATHSPDYRSIKQRLEKLKYFMLLHPIGDIFISHNNKMPYARYEGSGSAYSGDRLALKFDPNIRAKCDAYYAEEIKRLTSYTSFDDVSSIVSKTVATQVAVEIRNELASWVRYYNLDESMNTSPYSFELYDGSAYSTLIFHIDRFYILNEDTGPIEEEPAEPDVDEPDTVCKYRDMIITTQDTARGREDVIVTIQDDADAIAQIKEHLIRNTLSSFSSGLNNRPWQRGVFHDSH